MSAYWIRVELKFGRLVVKWRNNQRPAGALPIVPALGGSIVTSITFAPGDMLVLVTDGFTEAANPASGEMYGVERLTRFLMANRSTPGEALLERLAADVATFTGGAAQADDMTAVMIRRIRRM